MTFLDAIPSLVVLSGLTYCGTRLGLFGSNHYYAHNYVHHKKNGKESDTFGLNLDHNKRYEHLYVNSGIFYDRLIGVVDNGNSITLATSIRPINLY